MLRYVLLGLLADGQPAHGYALMKAYAERSGVRLSIGNIYRELQRLVGSSFIATVTNPVGADPRRAPYVITESGRHVLAEWLSRGVHLLTRTVPDELSHRLALVGDMDPDCAASFLDQVHQELWERAKLIERNRAAAARHEGSDEAVFPTRSILLGRQAKHLAADIELVDEMRTRFTAFRQRFTRAEGAVASTDRKPVRTAKQKNR